MQNLHTGIAIVLFCIAMGFLYTGLELSIAEEDERECHYSATNKKIRSLNLKTKFCYFVSGFVFFFGMFVASKFF
jgi:hypothetical protein